jgi:hypothetical protein
LRNEFVYFPKWKFTEPKTKTKRKSKTSNVLAIIDATVNGAESATGYDALDDELGGVNLPLVPGDSGRCFFFLFSVLVLLHSPCPAQMPLKLLVPSSDLSDPGSGQKRNENEQEENKWERRESERNKSTGFQKIKRKRRKERDKGKGTYCVQVSTWKKGKAEN